jgi:hypothetical protein
MAHKPTETRTIQIVAVKNNEELNEYIKGNEAHARLPTERRRVVPLADWESGRKTFERAIAVAEVRAEYEEKGTKMPARRELLIEAEKRMKKR